jgi:hypothetical protein
MCQGNSSTLTANGAGTYTWNAVTASQTLVVSPTGTSIYTVSGESGAGCSAQSTVSVKVNPLPVLQVNSTSGIVCPGGRTQLIAAGALTYTWIGQGQNTPVIFVNPSVTTVYSVMAADQNKCAASGSVMITVSNCSALEEEVRISKLSLYPNPAKDMFRVVSAFEKIHGLRILDGRGMMIREQEADGFTV